jgi:alpha-L-rhamnosidase
MGVYDLQSAVWIAPDRISASPIISRRFRYEHVDDFTDCRNCTLVITGLGYFEACINSKKVSEDKFQPVVSDYEPRDFKVITYPCSDTFTHRIYVCRYDISKLLKEGDNLLEIQLGKGWFVQNERNAEGEMSYGDRPKCIYSLILGDRIISSDGSEYWHDSEIVYSNLFIGEVHDPMAVSVEMRKVITLPNPKSELCEQIGAPDRLIRTIEPKLIAISDGRKIYDAGENISGVVRIHTKEGFYGKVTLRFAENLNPDKTLNFVTTGSHYTCSSGVKQIMTDTFVCDGIKRVFEPKFVWHAFRYFDAEGDFDLAEVLVIHSDVKVTAEFSSDSEGLNFLFDAYIRTQLDNMHGSIPSDCPHRERLGYTGDGQICAPTAMLMLDSREFYRKWIRDILDCQDIATGHIQHTAPFMGGGGGPGGWGCAVVLVPYYYWKQYGDVSILQDCYEPMKRWISYLISRTEGGLIVRESEGGWCLGDWCTLEKCRLPEPFVNTCYYVKSLRLICDIASEIGHSEDIPRFMELAAESAEAIRTNYYNPVTGNYLDGTQGADAYAAWIGLAKVDSCVEYYRRLGHFDTGFLGTDILCEQLFENGYGDVAFDLLNSEEKGSFLYMKRKGATTLWEHWDGGSHNHPMFGACARQLFCGILGIRQVSSSTGWEKAVISPVMPKNLGYAKGSILTPRGKISVSLERKDNKISILAIIPDGISASLNFGGYSRELAVGANSFEFSAD